MGNIGSHTGHINPKPTAAEEQQWAHSFPRTQQKLPSQHKVLPEREVGIKLRTTNNGEILQSGGTLTGRHLQNRHALEKETECGPAMSPRSSQTKTYLSHQRDPLHKAGHRYTQALDAKQQHNGANHMGFREQMKKFGSEPDLRYSAQQQENFEVREKARLKKKYRAPPPPPKLTCAAHEKLWDENINEEASSPIRRARLFKTRAETKKIYSSPVNNHKPLDFNDKIEPLTPKHDCGLQNEASNEIHEPVQLRQRNAPRNLRQNRMSLPEVKLASLAQATTDFQEELKEATKRLRHSKILESSRESLNNEKNQKDSKEKLKTLDHNIKQKDNLRQKLKQLAKEHQKFTVPIDCVRGEGSGKESSSPDQSPPDRNSRNISKDKNPKTFYFGMDNQAEDDFNNEIIDNFTSSLHATTRLRRCSSESDLSSDLEMDESQTSRIGIDLHLRPILPKKQLEIPRFSPAAAWRLLSTIDANHEASTITSDDVQAFIEERIEKFARPPPPPTLQVGQRSNNDKSGDSGISGDAGPAGFDDGPDIASSRSNLQRGSPFGRNQGLSWTPQQDLGDDSSLEEGTNHTDEAYKQKFANKPHVFSLSLPRDNHLAAYMGDRQMIHTSTSLQKLKRSVSGVLNNLGNSNRKMVQSNTHEQNDNWFLSKSAPNSLNNGFNSLDVKNSHKSDDPENSLVPNSKHSSGRLMYLPEFSDFMESKISRMKGNDEKGGSQTDEGPKHKLSVYSKSCENISVDLRSSSEPEDLQDPPPRIIPGAEQPWKSSKKPKRFTFQSTVRQIERKRLADKLSREAERKEMQRLRELEAMQKVEEEFQKKRAREKANIRHQLRLFTMDDASWSSLPDMDAKDGPVPRRPEPDGAVSSATSSPSLPLQKSPEITKKFQKNKKLLEMKHKHRANSESSEENKVKAPATQVLSEYRQPQREYKEYRGSTRYLNDLSDAHNKQTTVHPQVTCNMPKATPQSSAKHGKKNRKDLAHGVKSTRSTGSTYSEESHSRGNSPRMYHNKHSPITRF